MTNSRNSSLINLTKLSLGEKRACAHTVYLHTLKKEREGKERMGMIYRYSCSAARR